MNTETPPVETNAPDLLDSATYEMESNKLRLYVGRVDRPTFDRLRAEGWQVTPKQGCDFAAVWTPQRRATALELCDCLNEPGSALKNNLKRFSKMFLRSA